MAPSTQEGDIWGQIRRGEAVVVDVRPPGDFCHGHPPGAISVPYSARGFGLRVAVAAPDTRAMALVASDPWQAEDAARQLAALGRACLGVLPDDPAIWEAAALPWATLAELPVSALRAGPEEASRLVLDVREPLEWETGHVPGAWLVPLGRLRHDIERLPREREIVVVCEAGVRSATAASILQAAGFPRVAHVPTGTADYRRTGWPLAFPPKEEVEGDESDETGRAPRCAGRRRSGPPRQGRRGARQVRARGSCRA